MSTPTAALDLDSLESADYSLVEERRSLAARDQAATSLHRITGVISAVALTPLLLVALSALLVMLIAKLLMELLAAAFER